MGYARTEAFCAYIDSVLRSNGITQMQAGELCGLSGATFSSIHTRSYDTTNTPALRKIVEGLGLDWDYVIGLCKKDVDVKRPELKSSAQIVRENTRAIFAEQTPAYENEFEQMQSVLKTVQSLPQDTQRWLISRLSADLADN